MGTVRKLSVTSPYEPPSWATDLEKREIVRLADIVAAIDAVDAGEVQALLDEISAANSIWFLAGAFANQTIKTVFSPPEHLELSDQEKEAETTLISVMASAWVAGLLAGSQLSLQKGLSLDDGVPHY